MYIFYCNILLPSYVSIYLYMLKNYLINFINFLFKKQLFQYFYLNLLRRTYYQALINVNTKLYSLVIHNSC